MLNARPESAQREAEIVAQAGRKGAVTIATNMAGRGTDILLGGSPAAMARLRVREALAAAAHVATPPTAGGFYPSELPAEVESLLAVAAKAYADDAAAAATTEGQQLDERAGGAAAAGAEAAEEARAEAKARAALGRLDEVLAVASSAAAVTEGSATDSAREAYEAVLEVFEAALEAEKQEVVELGGLHIIGTNLHDSRRVDDQLRGRAGRQGDPGSSHFFLSLDDRVFRIFGGDKIKGVLDFLRVPDDQPLESDRVAAVVADTQAATERYYYEIRKTLFDFDGVLAAQREKTYVARADTVRASPAEVHALLLSLSHEVAADLVKANWPAAAAALDADAASTLIQKIRQFFPRVALAAAELQGQRREAVEAAARAAAGRALETTEEELDGVRAGLACETARYASRSVTTSVTTSVTRGETARYASRSRFTFDLRD